MRLTAITLGLWILAACQPAETDEQAATRMAAEADSSRREIMAFMPNWERWLAAGQVDSAAPMLANDYQALAPNQAAVAGRANALAWMRELMAQGRVTFQHTSEAIEVNGPLAVQRGRFTMSFVPGPRAPRGAVAVSDTGKFLWHWRRLDGHWRLAAAAWNSDLPAKP